MAVTRVMALEVEVRLSCRKYWVFFSVSCPFSSIWPLRVKRTMEMGAGSLPSAGMVKLTILVRLPSAPGV